MFSNKKGLAITLEYIWYNSYWLCFFSCPHSFFKIFTFWEVRLEREIVLCKDFFNFLCINLAKLYYLLILYCSYSSFLSLSNSFSWSLFCVNSTISWYFLVVGIGLDECLWILILFLCNKTGWIYVIVSKVTRFLCIYVIFGEIGTVGVNFCFFLFSCSSNYACSFLKSGTIFVVPFIFLLESSEECFDVFA